MQNNFVIIGENKEYLRNILNDWQDNICFSDEINEETKIIIKEGEETISITANNDHFLSEFSLIKPISIRVFFDRINYLLEHYVKLNNNYILKPNNRVLKSIATNAEIHLTEKEASLLRALSESPSKTLTKQEILQNIWKYNASNTHTIETLVYRLRQKLPEGYELLLSHKDGYSLNI
jgi:hypothetical protein